MTKKRTNFSWSPYEWNLKKLSTPQDVSLLFWFYEKKPTSEDDLQKSSKAKGFVHKLRHMYERAVVWVVHGRLMRPLPNLWSKSDHNLEYLSSKLTKPLSTLQKPQHVDRAERGLSSELALSSWDSAKFLLSLSLTKLKLKPRKNSDFFIQIYSTRK